MAFFIAVARFQFLENLLGFTLDSALRVQPSAESIAQMF